VLTGDGDPHRLLSRLYFWTWNTQEVFDMIQWMRQWNTTAPPSQRVQFLGFDMQYPGASMDSVLAYVTRLDPDNITYVTTRYQCMASYRNHAQVIESTSGYATLPTATQLVCAGALQDVYDLIRQSAAKYTAASSPAVYEQMLHHARLVQQFEMMISGRPGAASRDQSMAENVRWIRDHAPVGAKIALWAHNGHIDAVSGTMGGAIRDAYGADYVPLGFVFGTGSFNAVGTPTGGLGAWQTTLIPPASIEAAFSGVGKPLVLFDTRRIPSGGTAAAPLAGPIPMRSIGAVWSQGNDALYFGNEIFPNDFNLLIYVAHTTQSSLLPFTY
jgi:erythromycin esterase